MEGFVAWLKHWIAQIIKLWNSMCQWNEDTDGKLDELASNAGVEIEFTTIAE